VVAVTIILRRLWPLEGYKSVVAMVLVAVGAMAWAVGMYLARRERPNASAGRVLKVSTCRILTVGTFVLATAGFMLGVLSPG